MDRFLYRRKKLKELIDTHHGGVMASFAKKTGIDPSYVSRLLYKEDKPGFKRISDEIIEKINKVYPGWLNTKEDANITAGPDIRGRVPVISWVQAGNFSMAIDLNQPGIADEFIETTVQTRKHTFALRVKGDSMEPVFPEGTILIVEPEMEAIHKDYVIAKNGDEEATFKQLIRDGGDWYLKPLNERYPIKPLDGCSIVGVVRAAERQFR